MSSGTSSLCVCVCVCVCVSAVEVSCSAYEGIDAVKAALKAGLRQSTEEMPLDSRLLAPPQYVITTTTLDRTEGIAKLNTAIQVGSVLCACASVCVCVCLCVCVGDT